MPNGGFFVYADCSRFTDDSERFCRDVLEGAGVAITPGIDFGRHRASQHVRFAYTIEQAQLEDGVARLAATCERMTSVSLRDAVGSSPSPRRRTALLERSLVPSRRRCCSPAARAVDTLDFYWQGAAGQLDLIARARPISEVIDEARDAALRQRLARVQEIRAFASRELALPDNASYTRYTDLGRPFVRVERVRGAGAVAQAAAMVLSGRRLRQLPRLFQRGRGARRGGAAAGERRRRACVRRARVFDARLVRRSGAVVVRALAGDRGRAADLPRARAPGRLRQGRFGVQRVVRERGRGSRASRAGSQRSAIPRSTRRSSARSGCACAFRAIVRDARARLAAVYASSAERRREARAKIAAFAAMKAAYEEAKAGEPGLAGYERWFAQEPNNASLAAIALYTDRVPAFRALLAE